MLENVSNEVVIEQQVYLVADIQKILGIGKSRSYTFPEEIYRQNKECHW